MTEWLITAALVMLMLLGELIALVFDIRRARKEVMRVGEWRRRAIEHAVQQGWPSTGLHYRLPGGRQVVEEILIIRRSPSPELPASGTETPRPNDPA
jgi:hypothetical protein